jgi:hypothetical protein
MAMKKLKILMLFVSFLSFDSVATASIYKGTWNNTTFVGSSGALTIDLKLKNSNVSGSFDLGGPVFGGNNPGVVEFDVQLEPNQSGTLEISGTDIGDIAGSFNKNGKLNITISNIPGGFLTEVRINGKFDLATQKFTADYEVDNAGGLYARGVAEAHVPQSPKVIVAGEVNFSGNKGAVEGTVHTNTSIQSVKATASDGNPNVTVIGKNPFRVEVKNISVPSFRVSIVVRNADGFQTTKVVKFIKIGPVNLAFEQLFRKPLD